ncbi:hypothetical protein V6N12_076359 [Hibiscus sabdariffa]|uniref:Uncharacterized protein n=1 Tax=Hibiscus sabdariffa TaxID=183260 RepID=A0ABR2D9K2_9ROSI
MLRLYLCKGFNNLLEQDDKGDVSAETTGPAPVEVSSGIQISVERLLCYWLIPKITRRGHIFPPKGRKRSSRSNARLGAVLKQFQVDDIQNPPGQQLWHRPGQSWPKISRRHRGQEISSHGRFEQNQAYFLPAQIFPPRPKIFCQAKAASCPARTANQSPAEAGLDKKYKVECDWISIFF